MVYMNKILIFALLLLSTQKGFTQNPDLQFQNAHKGSLYIYWGWNWGWYTKSDITFKGTNYNFTLKDVVANDRQSSFSLDTYFNPSKITIPQYNLRIGYFITDKWNISFGSDHMKYVVQQNQTVKISGTIQDSKTPYDGVYADDDISIKEDFLQFEHTDGLNYLNVELRRFDKIIGFDKISINHTEGLGIGALMPRTNTTLLNKERYDEFHFAGYGIGAVLGINVTFFNTFFVQSEFKEGFINMPDIRTTSAVADKAEQNFFFSQLNIVFGGTIKLRHHAKAKKPAG